MAGFFSRLLGRGDTRAETPAPTPAPLDDQVRELQRAYWSFEPEELEVQLRIPIEELNWREALREEQGRKRALIVPLRHSRARERSALSELETASRALEEAPQHARALAARAKALFRRGQARHGLKDFDAALKDLTLVASLEPKDKGIANELARLKKTRSNEVAKEKKMYSKMFG